ncbi:MAG TPA: hypothetical protein VLL97_06145, partial [Acidobacteriota bacterium]|nr:hypothetical protein [Acidobacteriota bacterium]
DDMVAEGHYFLFDEEGRSSGMIRFIDYVRLPDKARFESGNREKDRNIVVVDLDNNHGWIRDGRKETREATSEEMREYRNSADRSLYNIFQFRREDPQNRFFYLGAGAGHEASREMVKIISPENVEVTVHFDRVSRLPVKIESLETNHKGIRQRLVDEYSQWRSMQGAHVPMRIDQYINGRRASQQFIMKIEYNRGLQDQLFGRP